MEIIKYRAFDKQDGNMYDVAYINFAESEIGIYNQLGKVDPLPWDERLVLMQFTGLKDKNGKEIYEGDIVRVVYDGSLEIAGGDDEVREVTWGAREDEYYPAFDLKGHDMETNALSVAKNNGDIEIIGNIYQTPELLTV